MTRLLISLIPILLAITISGCSTKPWLKSLNPLEEVETAAQFARIQARDEQMPQCFDTDLKIFYSNSFSDHALSGYLVVKQPDAMKFIVSNPFGQPLLAVAHYDDHATYINTQEQLILEGTGEDFKDSFKIPSFVDALPPGEWLTAKIPQGAEIALIRTDREARGSWVTLAHNPTLQQFQHHLLIDGKKLRLLERILTDSDNFIKARISYRSWFENGSPSTGYIPREINVSELDYGGEVTLIFKDLHFLEQCVPADFILPQPESYLHKTLGNYQ